MSARARTGTFRGGGGALLTLLAALLASGSARAQTPQRPPATQPQVIPQLDEVSRRPIDPSAVPEALRHLIPIVQRWAPVASDGELYDVADAAEADARLLAELEQFPELWTPEVAQAYEAWSDEVSITDSHEAAKFYFMLGLLDTLEIKLPSHRGDPVEAAIRRLQKLKGIGAAAGRMWAARELAERGPEARAALPALRQATADALPSVCAWAHAAIALIEEDEGEHRQAIEAILAEPIADEIERSSAESALEELDRPAEERARRRLMSSAIMNDVETIRMLSKTIDVNGANDDGTTAISLAVGNSNADAMRALLEAGADPNQRDRHGDLTLLHHAAVRHRGRDMIPLLLENGADPQLRDKEGRTPLDLAVAAGREANARLLQAQASEGHRLR